MNYLVNLARRIESRVPPDLLPAEDRELLFLMYAVLGLVLGDEVRAEDVHNAWTAWMSARGEHHEAMVPFDQLPTEVRAEDEPFARAIREALHAG